MFAMYHVMDERLQEIERQKKTNSFLGLTRIESSFTVATKSTMDPPTTTAYRKGKV